MAPPPNCRPDRRVAAMVVVRKRPVSHLTRPMRNHCMLWPEVLARHNPPGKAIPTFRFPLCRHLHRRGGAVSSGVNGLRSPMASSSAVDGDAHHSHEPHEQERAGKSQDEKYGSAGSYRTAHRGVG